MIEEKELWENRNKGEIWVSAFDSQGKERKVRIRPGGNIHLTTRERKLNQERAYDESLDFFTNGTLSIVKMVDTAEDAAEVLDNPNVKSEKELQALFAQNASALKKDLAQIDSPMVLARLKEMVENEDSPNITMAKARAVEERYVELNPSVAGKVFKDFDTEGVKSPQRVS